MAKPSARLEHGSVSRSKEWPPHEKCVQALFSTGSKNTYLIRILADQTPTALTDLLNGACTYCHEEGLPHTLVKRVTSGTRNRAGTCGRSVERIFPVYPAKKRTVKDPQSLYHTLNAGHVLDSSSDSTGDQEVDERGKKTVILAAGSATKLAYSRQKGCCMRK